MSIGSDVGGSKDLAGGEQNKDKKWFNLLAAMRNRLSPNPSKQATPASSRPASPLQSVEADLEQAISKLSVNQSDCLLPPGTTTFNDREQQKLTEQLFRTLDTVKVQQGAAAAAELANSGKPKQLTLQSVSSISSVATYLRRKWTRMRQL
ncbi:hypothetical protein BCR33DRAFT_504958 [Rhizoclosmatium globosum]|uniref:Uncharacterized protein n=1 Tax=Rhizoclosmatium globosum TaxID=329046 RepID=A0A1Y2BKA4_9FUNG|nr:hypothetical protein BCR33DRAFT_504958 [Rhizoclosmatium globosum]|eukprot:ORY35202.1 hypothetical protein BCR33DRAFT_504958 [Rhizoclosmatium globosum]